MYQKPIILIVFSNVSQHDKQLPSYYYYFVDSLTHVLTKERFLEKRSGNDTILLIRYLLFLNSNLSRLTVLFMLFVPAEANVSGNLSVQYF